LDYTDRAAFLELGERHEITGIVHLAAAGADVADPVSYIEGYTQGPLNVFRAAQAWKVPRVAVASTVGVYIGVDETPFREDAPVPLSPVEPIPVLKKAAELFGALVAEHEDVEIVNLRLSTIWGPLGPPDSPFFAVPHLVHAAVRGRRPDPSPPRPPAYARARHLPRHRADS
jgi:UDP-glucose 4-epimerase